MTPLRRRPAALMYHAFSHGRRADDPYDLHVADDALEAQLTALAGWRWRPLPLDGYLAALDSGRGNRSYLVTMDDGFASVGSIGAPILARHGVPSVLFALPGLLGGVSAWLDQQPDEPMLDADTLRALPETGMEIGVHSWDHTSMRGLSDGELRRQVVDARDAVADVVGIAPRAFAYPFGDFDGRAIDAVRRAGFAVAFSVYSDCGRHAISRPDVKPADSPSALRFKLIPGYRVVWRAAGAVKPFRRGLRRVVQRW